MTSVTSFHDFWFGLSAKARTTYAQKVGTSEGYMEKVASGNAAPSLGMLARMVEADRRVKFEGVLATWRAGQARRGQCH